MSGNDRIQAAIEAFARETANSQASPRVRARLLREVRKRRIRHAAPWWLAAAAALVIGIALGLWPRFQKQTGQIALAPPAVPAVNDIEAPRVEPEEAPAIPPQLAAAARRAARAPVRQTARPAPAVSVVATPWIVHQALPVVQRGQVLRLPMTAELARQFGVPPHSGGWQAEVFIGDDGLARAFRLVRVPAYK
jgi:hypothetical protein